MADATEKGSKVDDGKEWGGQNHLDTIAVRERKCWRFLNGVKFGLSGNGFEVSLPSDCQCGKFISGPMGKRPSVGIRNGPLFSSQVVVED